MKIKCTDAVAVNIGDTIFINGNGVKVTAVSAIKDTEVTPHFDPEHPYPIAPQPSNAPAQWDALGGYNIDSYSVESDTLDKDPSIHWGGHDAMPDDVVYVPEYEWEFSK